MDQDDTQIECDVCGCTRYYKEAGHFYCQECQTQSQQIQDHVFERDEETIGKNCTRKVHKEKPDKPEDKLTSWECYNFILKSLTDELIGLGAKPELKNVTKLLWMKYLHKCEVFDIKCDRTPKVSILGSKKDIAILYNVKKRKRRRSVASGSTCISVRRERSKKRRSFIRSHYEKLSQTHQSTQASSLLDETLSSVKSESKKSDVSVRIEYNRFSNAELRRQMSKKHLEKHRLDATGDMPCHKLNTKTMRTGFSKGPSVLTSFTLHSILYMGLRIIDDRIQLGDMLRFVREGHLSYGNYAHFFDDSLSDKLLILPKTHEKLLVSDNFRKRTAKLAQFLGVSQFIRKPDLVELSRRYCEELNLPREVFDCVRKFIVRTGPRMKFRDNSKHVPNYEGRAISFVLFALKLLFGLDGVTENAFSGYAKTLKSSKIVPKMFDMREWLKYIAFRDIVIRNYHLPTALIHGDKVDSDMYLEYLENQRMHLKSGGKKMQNEVKDYRKVFAKLLDSIPADSKTKITFESSLTPFLSYANVIVENESICGENALKSDFSDDSLDFLLRPGKYLEVVGNRTVKNGGGNENIVTEDPLYLNRTKRYISDQNRKSVVVRIANNDETDNFVKEYLNLGIKSSLRTTDVNVLLSNWQKSHQNRFSKNTKLLKTVSSEVTLNATNVSSNDTYEVHFNPFERYWLNVPANPVTYFLSKDEMKNILTKMPLSLRMLVKECSRIVEQNVRDFYSEFLATELCLVYGTDIWERGNKGKRTVDKELRSIVKICTDKW